MTDTSGSLKFEVELRCNACDTVLVVASIRKDEDGVFAYVFPCPNCAAVAEATAEQPQTAASGAEEG